MPRRLRQARGSACRRRREHDTGRSPALSGVGTGEAGAIEKSSGGRANSLRIRRVAAYTAHSSVASPESRTTRFFRARKEKTARRAVPASGLRPPQAQGKQRRPRTMPETSDANRPGMSTTVAAGTEKSPGTNDAVRETTVDATDNTAGTGHPPRAAHPAMRRRRRPALLLKQARHAPPFRPQKRNTPRARRKKRRSAKPKFCRTPDRHGSGLARSLNRTFSYRMKLVRMTGSFSGSGTPAALPASKQRSIHAMFLAS